MASATANDAPTGFGAALERLKSAQKPGTGVPAYTRWVNRSAGRLLAAGAYTVGLSPNQVTMISGLVSLVGIALVALAPVELPVLALAVLLLLFGYALDSADGQVARLTGVSSKAGEWLDHVVDAARTPAFHMAVAAALWRSLDGGSLIWTVLPLAFALLVSTWFFSQILASQLLGKTDTTSAGASAPWVSFAKLPSDTGTLYAATILLPWPALFLPLYGGLFLMAAAQATLSFRRRFRDLTSTGASHAAPRGCTEADGEMSRA